MRCTQPMHARGFVKKLGGQAPRVPRAGLGSMIQIASGFFGQVASSLHQKLFLASVAIWRSDLISFLSMLRRER